ncbi:MAG: tRNA uridine-5-carboxymethylaminomethyl(34) synthesis GTPase MnmE [Armatimonadetes bacterium]|nr:tRNA uridine-5-carboxymethylaminomethyl(34) synthesis GTPase MnmE [Armatimonadota bacterium]
MSLFDTIVAPITGTQRAAVATIRLSGPEAWRIAQQVFTPWPDEPASHRCYYGTFAHGDDGLLTLFRHGHSFTGEESAELSIHGSPVSVELLVRACLAQGARAAEPGEFTRQALLNGRVDLSQAEAIVEAIEARTERQLTHASRLREGALRREIDLIVETVLCVLAEIEAHVDFSEELGVFDRSAAIDRLSNALGRIQVLLDSAPLGKVLRDGFRVAIIGRPNVGKSSLLNKILGQDRAIVTDIPGTTRDTVEETIELDGILVRFIDTAGIRETTDPVEQLGIARSHQAVEEADLVLELVEPGQEEVTNIQGHVVVLNKVDLPGPRPSYHIAISARTGEGIDELLKLISDRFPDAGSAEITISVRHHPLLQSAHDHVRGAMGTLGMAIPFDLAVTHLREALSSLGEVTGATASADILDTVFSRFCIGK